MENYVQRNRCGSWCIDCTITSPSFDHEAAVLQCFHFWFFIDGFFDGVKNESLKVVQQSAGDVPENELWNWPSATLEWSEVLFAF